MGRIANLFRRLFVRRAPVVDVPGDRRRQLRRHTKGQLVKMIIQYDVILSRICHAHKINMADLAKYVKG